MDWYPWVKVVHVLSAIVAVGTNLTYVVWLRWVRERSEHSAFVLHGVQSLDRTLANPGYVVLPVTGITMVLISPDLEFSTLWIATAIGLYIAVAVFAGVAFSPSLRRQVELAEGASADTGAYAAAARRTMATGTITMVLVAVIIVLMVVKPR